MTRLALAVLGGFGGTFVADAGVTDGVVVVDFKEMLYAAFNA